MWYMVCKYNIYAKFSRTYLSLEFVYLNIKMHSRYHILIIGYQKIWCETK